MYTTYSYMYNTMKMKLSINSLYLLHLFIRLFLFYSFIFFLFIYYSFIPCVMHCCSLACYIDVFIMKKNGLGSFQYYKGRNALFFRINLPTTCSEVITYGSKLILNCRLRLINSFINMQLHSCCTRICIGVSVRASRSKCS